MKTPIKSVVQEITKSLERLSKRGKSLPGFIDLRTLRAEHRLLQLRLRDNQIRQRRMRLEDDLKNFSTRLLGALHYSVGGREMQDWLKYGHAKRPQFFATLFRKIKKLDPKVEQMFLQDGLPSFQQQEQQYKLWLTLRRKEVERDSEHREAERRLRVLLAMLRQVERY